MDTRRLTALAIIAAIIAMSAAVMVPSLTDAQTSDGAASGTEPLSIVVQGGGSAVDLSMENNESVTLEIYVTNNSADRLSLVVKDIKTDVLSSSSTVSIINSDNGLLFESGDGEDRNVAIITTTFKADNLADTQTFVGAITLVFTDINTGEVFEMTVPVSADIKSVYTFEGAYNRFFGVFPNTLPEPFNNVLVTAVVTLVIWILATIAVCEIVIPMFIRLFKKKTISDKKSITNTLTKTISVMMLVIAINECLNIVGANAEVMSTVGRISMVLYVLIGAVLAWQIYVFLITNLIKGIDEGLDVDGIDASLIPLFKMIGKIVICVVAATIILAAFGVDLAGIMVSAGVITLGITFGAQEIISQFFSGIVLLSTRPFKKGDFVSLNGTSYKVHKVRLMYTEFENWDRDQIITMPNNVVSSATMVNFTKGSPNTRIFIYVTVAYDANLTLAKELMIRAANMHPHVVKDKSVIPPNTRLTAFQDSGIEYRLACFVDDYDMSAHYAGQIREIIYKLFLDNGVDIPYNRLEVDLRSVCDGRKREGDDTPDI